MKISNTLLGKKGGKLWYYWDMTSNPAIWATDPTDARIRTGRQGTFIRVAHVNIKPPQGYTKTGDRADAYCEPIPKESTGKLVYSAENVDLIERHHIKERDKLLDQITTLQHEVTSLRTNTKSTP